MRPYLRGDEHRVKLIFGDNAFTSNDLRQCDTCPDEPFVGAANLERNAMIMSRKYSRLMGTTVLLGLWIPLLGHATETESVDFAKDIAPVIHEKCSNCHRKGQPGPFDLLSYQDVRNRAATIQAVLHDGYMPPWKPVSTQLRYANDRRLTTKEKQMFDAWVEAGMPAGDLDSIEKPDFSSEWSLGEPDLVVKMQGQFEVPASGPDVYRSFVFPIQLEKDQWVKAVELKPSAKGAVHHALFFIDSSGQARRLDGRDGKAGISGMSFLRGTTQSRSGNAGLGGYVPGAMPNKLPRDLAMLLPKGSDIVMQTHFHPTGKVEMESSTLGLYFADAPPPQQLNSLQLPPLFGRFANIDVPAGVNDYEIQDSMVLPVDVEVIQVSGHAHYICKEMDLRATLPDGQKMDLLTIDDWDLDWQDQYQFQEPVVLPAGTTLDVRILYDNSADNPKNPHSPPQRIGWGRESNDEMGSLILQLVAHDEKERPQLEEALESKLRDAARRVSRRPGVLAGANLRELAQREGVVKRLDANADGQLQWSEVPAALRQRVFEMADLNGDRVIDQKELGKLKSRLDR
jgi:hypothetical protein